MTAKVYTTLVDRALEALRGGHSIVLDATFSSRAHRTALRQLLDKAGFAAIWIEAQASDAVAMERLRRRDITKGVVSDARAEDYVRLSSDYESPNELLESERFTISTNDESNQTLSQLLNALAIQRASVDSIFKQPSSTREGDPS